MLQSMQRGLWRSLLILSLLFGASHSLKAQPSILGPANGILCNSVTVSSFSIASSFTLVSGKTGQGIYICGWSATTTNTASQTSFALSFTTGVCNGNVTSTFITPPHGVTSNAPVVDHQQLAFISAPNTGATATPNNMCLTTAGTGNNLQFELYFTQF